MSSPRIRRSRSYTTILDTAHFEGLTSLSLDTQHQSLFDLANAIELAIEQHPGDTEATADAVSGLVDYVVEHFQSEEAIIARYECPGAERHRALHMKLGGETLAPSELAAFVCDWLYEHIRVHDVSLVAFIQKANAAEREPVAL